LSSSPGNLSEDKTNRYFDAATMSVLPLPGTLTEVTNIKNLLEGGNLTVEFFAGKDATEANIKKVKYPKILHIATHGFFLPNLKNKDLLIDKETIQNEKNVLLRSGLLLAGCEKSMKGEGISSEEDGIFTAYEALNLFLDETDLVVLSACETGLGEVQNGEGVYGLQRAFQQAGAKSILISLWKVNDHATELLMTNFYNDFLKSGDQKQSFINAQKAVRKVYPEPYYWGAFVMVGTQ
jgi:CHAT domain-containing protein